jgi:hypothetical protein
VKALQIAGFLLSGASRTVFVRAWVAVVGSKSRLRIWRSASVRPPARHNLDPCHARNSSRAGRLADARWSGTSGRAVLQGGEGAVLRVFGSRDASLAEPTRWVQALRGTTLSGQDITLLDVALIRHQDHLWGGDQMPSCLSRPRSSAEGSAPLQTTARPRR